MPSAPALKPRPEPPARESGRGGDGGQVVAFEGGRGAGGSFRGGGGDGDARSALAIRVGMWIALAPLLMFFLALVSAYVVRQGLGEGWGGFPVPSILFLNTAVLLASSGTLERARQMAGSESGATGRSWLWATLGLGTIFLAGQVAAWLQLSSSGVGVSATPFSSYLYLFTGAHGVHLAGGLVALLAAALWPSRGRLASKRSQVIGVSAIYWHFLNVVWLGLFSLLVFWR